MIPLHRDNFQQRMNTRPCFYRHQYIVAALTAIENAHIIKIKINDVNLAMIFPYIVTETVYMVAPAAMNQHQIFPIQVLNRQLIFFCRRVLHGNSTAKGFPRYLKPCALTQAEHCFIKNPRNHIDMLTKVFQNLPCVFRCVLKRNELETAESMPSNRFGNGVSVTFTISSITTLTMVHIC